MTPINHSSRGRLLAAAAVATLLAIGGSGAAFADAPTDSLGEHLPSFAPMIERILPAVVNISVTQKVGAGGSGDENGDDDADPDSQDAEPGAPSGPRTPFDDFLRRFFEQQQQGTAAGRQARRPKRSWRWAPAS